MELAEIADPGAVRGRVPGAVLERYRRFFECPACGTLFWKGTHVENTCRKLGVEDASER